MRFFLKKLLFIFVNIIIGLLVGPIILGLDMFGDKINAFISLAILAFLPLVYMLIVWLLAKKISIINIKIVAPIEIVSIWVSVYYYVVNITGESDKIGKIVATVCVILPLIIPAYIAYQAFSDISPSDFVKSKSSNKEKFKMPEMDRKLSYSREDNFGNTIMYNKNGQVIGSARKNNFGQTIYKDEKGNITGSSRRGNCDNTVFLDKDGQIVGDAVKNPSGNVRYRDKDGNIIGRQEKDSFGNTHYKDN